MSNFDDAFLYTVSNEGNYTNDPNDSGGPTNFGITIGDLSRYVGRPATVGEVKGMTPDTAKIIYKKWYWDTLALDHVNSKGVAMAIFDQGLVRGISTIAIAVQNLVSVEADAHIGPITLAAINAHNAKDLIPAIEAQAERAFRAIVNVHPKDKAFLNGWLNRAHRLTSLEQYA